MSPTATGKEVARAIDAAERRGRSAVPIARVVDTSSPTLLRTAQDVQARTQDAAGNVRSSTTSG